MVTNGDSERPDPDVPSRSAEEREETSAHPTLRLDSLGQPHPDVTKHLQSTARLEPPVADPLPSRIATSPAPVWLVARSVIPSQSPASTRADGATQDPPTQITLGSVR